MSDVKRYDYGYKDDGCGGDRYLGLIEKPDGALVRHSDYAALEAECERLRAQVSAQQSEHVSVPRELLERVATHLEWDGDESQTVIQYANKCDALAAELSALLNGGEA